MSYALLALLVVLFAGIILETAWDLVLAAMGKPRQEWYWLAIRAAISLCALLAIWAVAWTLWQDYHS